MKRIIVLTLLIWWAMFSLSAQKEFTAKIDHATVYLQGAALTHTATANLKSGTYDILINGLSPDIEVSSLKVTANGVLISASEFSNDFITPKEESARIQKLQDSLELYKRQLQEARDELTVHTHLLKMLTDGTLYNMQQKDGTVSVADINANMELYKSKAGALQRSIDQDNRNVTKLQETVNRLQKQLNQDMTKDKQRTGVLRLSVSVPQTVNTEFTITYFTDMAGWVPCYDINIASMDKPVVLKSKAQVTQVTGLDWNNVKLTLSNATPNRTKEAPVFKTWFLNFYRPQYSGKATVAGARSNTLTYALSPLEGVSAVDGEMVSAQSNAAPILMDEYVEVDMQEVAVNYNISVPYDIPGNGKAQLIDLKNYDIKAEYKYYSIPKLSDETYLIATLSDYEQYNLLPGYATVTFDNTFVGSTFLRPNATEEHVTLTLTTDPRVSVKREKQSDYCSTKHVGSTTTVTQSYLITVKNNQTKTAKLTLKEQYPISNNKDIEVKLGDVTPNATYNKEDIGVLTWDVELKPGETRTFSVTYSVKYPKDKNVNL
ncbi:MAG: mucoidy inhibitor MuiA family protein [Bacteroidales bacterium]|nr:mucoidy inhibitor MuiA family protein [Bacteroidales bacterium]